jgi:hypothetical protein
MPGLTSLEALVYCLLSSDARIKETVIMGYGLVRSSP